MQIEPRLVELHIPQYRYAIMAANMQALISNNQEFRFRRNENTVVYNRFSYSFDISRRQSPPYKY